MLRSSFPPLFLLLMLSLTTAQAQRLRFHPMHHEFALLPVGMGQVQAITTGNDWPAQPGTVFFRHQAYGLYKYHFNKYQAVRGGIGYEASTLRSVGDLVFNNQETNYTVALLRAGYEHKLPLGRFQLYGGGELAYALGKTRTVNISEFGQTTASTPVNEARIQGFVGLRFFANKHLSFQVENTVFRTLGAGDTGLTANWLQAGVSIHGKKMKKKCTCGKPGS